MPNQQLITHARGHVTGEYAQNTVYLTGERVSDAGFYQNIRLSVQPSIGSAETCIRRFAVGAKHIRRLVGPPAGA